MTSPTVNVAVKADTSQFIAAMNQAREAAQAVSRAGVKPGIRTTEFWASAVAPMILVLLTFVFHHDFSGYVQAAALGAAGLSTAVYALGRAHLKKPTSLASMVYDAKAIAPVAVDAVNVAEKVAAAAP